MYLKVIAFTYHFFFGLRNNYTIFDGLKQDLMEYSLQCSQKCSSESELLEHKVTSDPTSDRHTTRQRQCNDISFGMVDWSQHLRHENPTFSKTFNAIIQTLSDYFCCEIYASRLNYYRNGNDWKPFHHDSHAYCPKHQDKEDLTIGASFGMKRELEFKHVKSQQIFGVPQNNNDIFAFTSIVNEKFQHGVPKDKISQRSVVNQRFSIVVWGKRRELNERNSGSGERTLT